MPKKGQFNAVWKHVAGKIEDRTISDEVEIQNKERNLLRSGTTVTDIDIFKKENHAWLNSEIKILINGT